MMFNGWVQEIPNVRHGKIGPRTFEVIKAVSACSAGQIDPSIKPRGVVHETQTKYLPAYSGSCPHFTIGPRPAGGWKIFQHLEMGKAACALVSAGGSAVGTNYWARVQVELCGYTTRDKHLPHMPPVAVAMVESFFEWCQEKMEIPERYPYDPGAMASGLWASVDNPWRKSKKWENESGWHPHAAVDHNSHWDVGGLLVPALFKAEPTPDLVTGYGVVEVFRPPGDDHRTLREIVAPVRSLKEALSQANTKKNRDEVKNALSKKGHQVRVVKRLVEA
jgi:hypothetical protein